MLFRSADKPESAPADKGGGGLAARQRPSAPAKPPARTIAAAAAAPAATPAPDTSAPTIKTAPVARPEPEPEPEPVFVAPRMEPVAQRASAAADAPPPNHRWPTDEESLGLEPSEPVTVAALANSAPYDPVQATADRYPSNSATNGTPVTERTRNGLVKRQPRHRGGGNSGNSAETSRRPAPPAPTPARHSPGESTPERNPTEVGTMLAAFRRGHQRGELNGRHAGGDEPSHVVQEEPGDH